MKILVEIRGDDLVRLDEDLFRHSAGRRPPTPAEFLLECWRRRREERVYEKLLDDVRGALQGAITAIDEVAGKKQD